MEQKVDPVVLLKKYPELNDYGVGPFNITTLQILCALDSTDLIKIQLSTNKNTESYINYINLPNYFGPAPLHYAAFNNNTEIVQLLILNGAEVNNYTKSVFSAKQHITVDKWNEIKDILLIARCDNPEAIFPLYCSVYNKSFDAFELLIQNKADILNSEFNSAFLEKALNYNTSDFLYFLSIILKNTIDRRNEIYENVIKAAIDFNHPKKLHSILKKLYDDEPKEVVNIELSKWLFSAASFGHDEVLKELSKRTVNLDYKENEETLVENIFNNISRPNEYLLNLLDKHISLNQKEKISEIRFDFSILLSTTESSQMEILNNLCISADKEEIQDLIKHPLIDTFLKIKWAKVRLFFMCQILIYLIFVLSLSTFVLMHLRKTTKHGITCVLVKYVLAISALESFVHSFLQLVLCFRKSNSKYEILISMTCTTLSILIALVSKNPVMAEGYTGELTWKLHAMSVSVLLAWAELMLLIGRLPTFGYYALMFAVVLQNVIKVLLTFICLVIGFSLSFLIQFSDSHHFQNPWLAVVKTTVMMMGEYEYGDLFSPESHQINRLPATSRIIFMLFVILVSIVLMNLMIGLAVSDIQDLKKDAHVKRQLKQIDFLKNLDQLLILLQKITSMKRLTDFLKQKTSIGSELIIKSDKKSRRNIDLPKKYIDNLFINLGRREKKHQRSKTNHIKD